jgi:hypothetical protein
VAGPVDTNHQAKAATASSLDPRKGVLEHHGPPGLDAQAPGRL